MNLEGREICRCGNPSGQYSGMTFNSESQTVLDWWCADCGGAIEAPANIKVKMKIREKEPKKLEYNSLWYILVTEWNTMRYFDIINIPYYIRNVFRRYTRRKLYE